MRITRQQVGYMKIKFKEGGQLLGEGDSKEKGHEFTANWIPIYHDNDPEYPFMKTWNATNTNQGTATETNQPLRLNVCKEGFSSASGQLLKALHNRDLIEEAEFHFTVRSRGEGGEVKAGEAQNEYGIKIKNGRLLDWSVEYAPAETPSTDGVPKLDCLEYLEIMATNWEVVTHKYGDEELDREEHDVFIWDVTERASK